jgi:acylpyruvate hydrolase
MKLVVFGPSRRLGALLPDRRIVDLNLAYERLLREQGQARSRAHADAALPTNLLGFLEEGDSAFKAAQEAVSYATTIGTRDLVLDSTGVRIWAPLPGRTSRIIGVGGNVRTLNGGEMESSGQPMWGFWKLPQCVIGPDEPMLYPSRTKQFSCSVQLAAVIGKMGKHIPDSEQAMEYVFGYTGLNGSSIGDDPPPGHHSWVLSENFDASCCLGPCIVTKDEVHDPYDVSLRLNVNGRTVQDHSTGDMGHKFPAYMALVSRNLTLYPGDMIASGKDSGGASGAAGPHTMFLKVGDQVEWKVGNIGTMQHRVVAQI